LVVVPDTNPQEVVMTSRLFLGRIDKRMLPLDEAAEAEVRALLEDQKPLEHDLAQRLYNDLLRERTKARVYYAGLGPADGDLRHDAHERCYSPKLLAKVGER
jgi:hypothetical protein